MRFSDSEVKQKMDELHSVLFYMSFYHARGKYMIKNNDKKIFKHKIVIKTIYVGNKRFIDVFADVVLEDIKKTCKTLQ